MITETERPTGAKLRLLDLTATVAEASESNPLPEGETYGFGFAPYAAAEVDGKLYVICSEGVGWGVTLSEPLQVDLYVEKPDTIAIFPRLRALMSPDDVRAAMTTEEVDLADHVRRFGPRLEDNFWAWYRRLSTTTTEA